MDKCHSRLQKRPKRVTFRISQPQAIRKIIEQIILEHISGLATENKVTGNNQHWFTKDKSCQISLIAFWDKVTGSKDDRRAVDTIHLSFWRLSTLSPTVFLHSKLGYYGLGRWKTRWLYGLAQRVFINGLYSTWMLLSKGVPQWYLMRSVLFNTFINDLEDAMDHTLFKAADDTESVGPDDKLEDRAIIQRHLRQDGVNSL